ncbi:MAG: hypothetical protein WA542_07780 [Candidatus Acidiferrum sp.]
MMLLSLFLLSCNASRSPQYAPGGPLSQHVSNYQDSGHDLPTTVDDLMQKYKVPAGMDLEELSERRPISVNVPRGSVADVLSMIVAQQPGFKWAEMNGVVNIGPQQDTDSILDVRIAHFRVADASFSQIHSAIVSLPEVKRWLEDNHLTERTPMVIDGLVSAGHPFLSRISLDLQDITLREILNTVIKSSGFSSWIVSRYGEKQQYIMIGID